MKNHKEHYIACKKNYNNSQESQYDSIYDLSIDNNLLDDHLDTNYYSLMKTIKEKIEDKYTVKTNCYVYPKHCVRLNDWTDISELEELAKIFMPVIESKLFKSNAKIEFLHSYRNINQNYVEKNPYKPENAKSSWKWHVDGCPDEFIKIMFYLNEVNNTNGSMQYICDKNNKPIKYPANKPARISENDIKNHINKGGKIINATGKPGSYSIFNANILHRGSASQKNIIPRNILVFFIRPSLNKNTTNYLENTLSYFPFNWKGPWPPEVLMGDTTKYKELAPHYPKQYKFD